MKHFYKWLFAGGILLGTAAIAQNVIVVMKDGSSHKFNVDRLQEITFEEFTPAPEAVELTQFAADVYGGGNATVTMTDATNTNSLQIDFYGSSTAKWLEEGTYTCADDNAEFTFDPAYSKVKMDGEAFNITGGDVNVSIEGRIYTIEANLQLEGDREYKAIYVGQPATYTQWLEASMTTASYLDNPQPAGQFYVKMSNNGAPKYEIAIVFKADADATTLPAGEYAFAESGAAGTITSQSYIDTFNPYASLRLEEGSKAFVVESAGKYLITLQLNLSDGRTAEFLYEGEISGTPTFQQTDPQPEPELTLLDSAVVKFWNSENISLEFPIGDDYMIFDVYVTDGSGYLKTGDYVIGGSGVTYIGTDAEYTAYISDGAMTSFAEGKITVADTDEGVYTINVEAKTSTGKEIKAVYEGTIYKFSRIHTGELTEANFYDNGSLEDGEMYLKLAKRETDDFFGYTNTFFEMAIDFFTDGNVLEGKYVYAETGSPSTFGAKSYLDGFYPQYNARMAERSEINVTKEGNVYKIELNLKFKDGRGAILTYDGVIAPLN